MKKILLLVAIMLCCATAIFAQNNKISYQAVVRDTANRLVANKTVTVTVNIFNGDAQTAAYSETHTNVQTNYNGLFSLQMGNGTNQSGDWNAIQWKNARVTTAVSLDGTELATLNMPLTAVPYALYADYAEQINPDAEVVTNITNRMNTISDSVKTNFDNIAGNTSKLNALQNRVNVFNTHVCDTVMNCDGIKTMRDSIQTNAAAITALQSADAAITNRMNTISDSVKTNFNNIAGNTSKLNALQNRVNTFNTNICDTLMNCEKIVKMRDSIQTNAAAIALIGTDLATKANASEVYKKAETYTRTQVDSAITARINALLSDMPTMGQETFVVATDGQTVFQLANAPKSDYIYRMYINGVMVGGSNTQVLTISSTATKTMQYDASKNGNKTLKANDKVTIVYWY
jgi:archaellum component FlaC